MTGADNRLRPEITHDLVLGREAARIRAELTRADGTDPFASAVRATRMPMIITNPREADNPVVFVNDAFCRLSGYTRDELLGRNCRLLQGRDTDPATVARIREAVAHRRSIEIEIRNYRKDGTHFWNRLLLAPVHDADGQLSYFFASQLDVTLERERLVGLETYNAALLAEAANRRRDHRDSEARLRFATQAGRLGIWELDVRSHELISSAECRRDFGADPDVPLTYAVMQQAVHPEDRDAFAAAVRRCAAGEADIDLEIRVSRSDGATGWIQLRAQVERAADGAPLRVAGISLDTTERRAGELRLQVSEESLRLATDAAEVGTWDLDLTTSVLTWSDRTKEMFGLPADQACSMDDFYAGLHPDDRDSVGAAFAAALDPGIRAVYDVAYRTVGPYDGVVRWVAAKGKGLFQGGRCHRALGTAIDITARKEAEARQELLLRLADRLRAITDPRDILLESATLLGRHLGADRVGYGAVQADDATVVLDPCYAVGVEPLSGPFDLAGFGADAIALQRQGITVARDDVADDPSQDAQVWAAINTRSFVSVPLIRDGQFRASLYVNFRDARRWAPAEVALIEDVAARTWDAVERARAEADLRQVNEMLEQRVAAALQERAQMEEALRQAQKMEAVGQLTGGIAHDFNNLLTGISGSLEFLQRRVASGQLQGLDRYTNAATSSAQRAAALTQRLLAFARRQPLDPKRVDVNRLVAGMEELLRRTLGPAIELEMVLAGGLWPTLCDPHQIENSMLNLAINARDAMPDGGRLTIETGNAHLDDAYARNHGGQVEAGQYVGISVTDTGVGMTPDVLAKAFDPFFTTKPTGQGTGLGLSMVYGFVRQSKGHVRIYSEPGNGTTFRVYLPRYRGGAADEHDGAAGEALGEPQAEDGETVLVVDDEPTVRMLVTETLEELGYAALEAEDGAVALDILESRARIDLLVTDVGLPGLNGRQLADAARVARPGLRVLFMTGYAHNAAVGDGPALERGMQIISKPFSLKALAAKIRDMIESAEPTTTQPMG